jgi:hypothetical protein
MKGFFYFLVGLATALGLVFYLNGMPQGLRNALNGLTPTSAPLPSPVAAVVAEVTHGTAGGDRTQCLLIADGEKGKGSGFLFNFRGTTLIATNAHVISGNGNVRFQNLNSQDVTPTSTFNYAYGADLAVAGQNTVSHGLELADVDKEVRIGDDVVVLGNSLGSDVATEIPGKVTGIGPSLVEVDAKFVEGNSGSPIIQVKTGKVIGIATFVLLPRVTVASRDSQFSTEMRRFGYRLDTVRVWQHPTPQQFDAAAQLCEAVHRKTLNLITLAQDIAGGHIALAKYDAPDNPLRQIVTDYVMAANGADRTSLIPGDAREQLIHAVIFEMDSDTRNLQAGNFTWFHWHELQQEFEVRTILKRAFQQLESSMQTGDSLLH